MSGAGGPVVVVMRGLPGCGKSTWARAWVAEDPAGRARVNLDDLRAMLHASTFLGAATEVQVETVRTATVRELLGLGVSVVVDETNLPDRKVDFLREVARLCGADVVVVDLRGVPLQVCQARNEARTGVGRVPEEAMRRMFAEHIEGRTDIPTP